MMQKLQTEDLDKVLEEEQEEEEERSIVYTYS